MNARVLCGLLVVLCLLPLHGGLAEAEDFEEVKRKYVEYLRRPSFEMRARQRWRLAKTRDVRALKLLAADYAKAEEPREQVQSFLVSICADEFEKDDALPVFESWRAANQAPHDAWLWYRTLRRHGEHKGGADLLRVANGDEDLFLRLAAIEALAAVEDSAALDLVTERLSALPAEPFERACVLESMAACLLSQIDRIKEPEFEQPCKLLIHALDDKKTARRSQLVIARHLGKLFETADRHTHSGPWLVALKAVHTFKKADASDEYAAPPKPVFAGLQAEGDRIVYCIDMSDSMMMKLDPPTLKKLRNRPVITGGGDKWHRKGRKKKSPFADQHDIDWKKITTRFDAARAMLILSLTTLPEDKQFAVIGFGDKAEPLKSTPCFKAVTKKNLKKVVKELQAIRGGSPTERAPYGELWGKTNAHGALHRAFKMGPKGLAGPGEYVNRELFTVGCDVIFLLSDGVPSWTDWPTEDQKEPQDRAGDPESGVKLEDMPTLVFQGPYDETEVIRDDVRRMNLFRKAEIHCVGLGGADPGFLWDLADAGQGQVKMLGEDD